MKVPIVIDTNVLISGYLWGGKPRQAIRAARVSPYEILYCRESITELARIFSGKFNLAADEIIKILTDIKRTGRNVHVPERHWLTRPSSRPPLLCSPAAKSASLSGVSSGGRRRKLRNTYKCKKINCQRTLHRLQSTHGQTSPACQGTAYRERSNGGSEQKGE